MATAGKPMAVTGVIGGWGVRRRLADLGLTPGTPVTVVNGCMRGPLLIDVRGTRLGLGFGIAQKIMVKEAENG
jgi:Fe2+ transport system protein FeoA